jgi:hypothetical protein
MRRLNDQQFLAHIRLQYRFAFYGHFYRYTVAGSDLEALALSRARWPHPGFPFRDSHIGKL